MPKLRSAKKRLRQDQKRKIANKKKKNAIKTVERQIKKTLKEGKGQGEALGKLVNQFYQALDKAAKTGVIHKNKASREKSRLAVFITKHTAPAESKSIKPTASQVKRKIVKAGKKNAKVKSPRATQKKGSRRKAK